MSRYCNFVDFDETGIKLKVLPTQYFEHPLAGKLQNCTVLLGKEWKTQSSQAVVESCYLWMLEHIKDY